MEFVLVDAPARITRAAAAMVKACDFALLPVYVRWAREALGPTDAAPTARELLERTGRPFRAVLNHCSPGGAPYGGGHRGTFRAVGPLEALGLVFLSTGRLEAIYRDYLARVARGVGAALGGPGATEAERHA